MASGGDRDPRALVRVFDLRDRCVVVLPREEANLLMGDALDGGSIVAVATDTVFGLSARWDSEGARASILAIKGRPETLPLQILVDTLDSPILSRVDSADGSRLRRIGDAFWPGPLTAIVECDEELSRICGSRDGSVGIRWPAPSDVSSLIAGRPLLCTSSNLHGRPTPSSGEGVLRQLSSGARRTVGALAGMGLTHIVDRTLPGGVASTVVDIRGGRVVQLRSGPIELEEVERALGFP